MSGLVLVGDDLVPLNQVERATPAWDLYGKQPRGTVRVNGKDVLLASFNSIEAMGAVLMRPTQLVPVLPGTYVLRVWVDEAGPEIEVFKTAVVAWALCFDGETRPVTPHGVNDGNEVTATVYVAMPDGSVYSTSIHDEVSFYDNVESYRQGEGARKLKKLTERAAQDAQADRETGI